MTPLRGEYEDDNDDESWHDAREDRWETAACGKAKDGAWDGAGRRNERPRWRRRGKKSACPFLIGRDPDVDRSAETGPLHERREGPREILHT
jgi:hypothetical protein